MNGQITPLIVVADGEASTSSSRDTARTAAMRSLGLVEADAYVMDGWDDARIAQILNAENNHRKELTEAERRARHPDDALAGSPVADVAVSADIPEDKAESYVRGTKVVPVDAVNLDFEAVALMGEYDDVLTEDDVVAVLSKRATGTPPGGLPQGPRPCGRRGRDGTAGIARRQGGRCGLPRRGLPRVQRRVRHPLVAVVKPQAWGEGADVTFYCDDESHDYQPTPEEIAETEAYLGRKATLGGHGVTANVFSTIYTNDPQPFAPTASRFGYANVFPAVGASPQPQERAPRARGPSRNP